MLFNPSREDARNFLFESWRKHRKQEMLTPLENLALRLIENHPEYHTILENPDRYKNRDYQSDQGETNPFLHIMMHLTIEEQISIDQPAGVRAQFVRLSHKLKSEHNAQHQMMDCLSEMIWQAQRSGTLPNPHIYLICLERH